MFGWTHRTGSVLLPAREGLEVPYHPRHFPVAWRWVLQWGNFDWRQHMLACFFFCVVIFRCFMGDWDWYHETSLCLGGEFKICFMISPRALWSNLTIVNMFQMGGSTYSWWRFHSVKTWGFEYWISHHVLRVFHAFEVVVTTMSHHQHEQVTKSLSHYVHWLCCDI